MNYIGANLQMVKDDLERVWAEELANEMEGYHSFNSIEDGFEFQFAALPKKQEYISGIITVVEKKTR